MRYLFLFLVLVSSSLGAGPFVTDVMLDELESRFGKDGRLRVQAWDAMVQRDQILPPGNETEKLQHANDFFNQVPWLSDMEHWQLEDYWATPMETLASNGGDCEDFSIGKYFSLIGSKFQSSKLRITYVKSLTYNQAHMVLAYYQEPDAEPLILDNINKTILPASQRTDLLPIYSFNGESIWMAKGRGRKVKGSSSKSLPKWQELMEKMELGKTKTGH